MTRGTFLAVRGARATLLCTILILLGAFAASVALAQKFRERYRTDIPPEIPIADGIDTRLGSLTFRDGVPDEATAQKLYDNLDFQRGVQAVLTAMPAASLSAMRKGTREFGPPNGTVLLWESLMDSRTLALTANTDTVYAMAWIDLKDGPVVVESPPDTLGLVDDFYFHYVTDLGNAGPDRGRGGKYLLLPPDNKVPPPPGYFTYASPTYGNWLASRAFVVNGDPKPAANNLRKLRIYPLSKVDKQGGPPETKFVNVSGRPFNTIPATDLGFFEQVNEVVQEEPATASDPDTLGLLAAIGIEKGKPFAPDERMKRILTDAAAVGQATARAITYRTRLTDARLYPDSAWCTPFVGGSYLFERNGVRLLDARAMFFFYATGVTPAMSMEMVGVGSQYAAAFADAAGKPFDGAKSYRLHLPPGIPAKNFWSITVYDNQTRSMLQTNQQFPSVGSQKKDLVINPDTSVDIYFGPKSPAGKEGNWIETVDNKGWSTLLRLYGPLQPWFDKTWRPGEIEEVK